MRPEPDDGSALSPDDKPDQGIPSFVTRAWEARFQKVADGWVFRGPKRDGAGSRYLVNDAQKAKILATLPTTGQIMAFASMAIFVDLAATGVFEAVFKSYLGHRPQGLLKTLASMLMSTLISLTFTLGFMWLARHRLLVLVAELPMTEPPKDERPITVSFAHAIGQLSWSRMAIPSAIATSTLAFALFLDLSVHRDMLTQLTPQLGIATLASACCAVACLVSWARLPRRMPTMSA